MRRDDIGRRGRTSDELVESTFVTLDGVIEDPQVWSPPYWDKEHVAYASKLLEPADALLLGARPTRSSPRPGRSGRATFSEKLNTMPKHVASRTLTDATWNASIIEGTPPRAWRSSRTSPAATC